MLFIISTELLYQSPAHKLIKKGWFKTGCLNNLETHFRMQFTKRPFAVINLKHKQFNERMTLLIATNWLLKTGQSDTLIEVNINNKTKKKDDRIIWLCFDQSNPVTIQKQINKKTWLIAFQQHGKMSVGVEFVIIVQIFFFFFLFQSQIKSVLNLKEEEEKKTVLNDKHTYTMYSKWCPWICNYLKKKKK